MVDDHKHEIDWATEGPLWFCKCGAEFFPKKDALEIKKPIRSRTRLGVYIEGAHR